MDEVTQFLVRHGGLVLFAVVFAEQVGLPIPAIPVLLAAGALAGAGEMNLAAAIGLGVTACLAGDMIWYELGRHRGRQVLNILCRISLEPDSCVRRTESFFIRHGTRSLVLAKFIPGLSTVTPALAGLFGVKIERFLLWNGLGALLWTAAFVTPGYLFSDPLERIAAQAARFGSSTVTLIVGILVLYIVYKYVHRRLLLRELRIARITPEELKQMLDAGDDVVIVDLRQTLDVEADPYTIPRALRMAVEELEQRHHEIPRDRDVILFCACPNEVTAARMALLLKKNGVRRVRPLAGGVAAWRALNFPVQKLGIPAAG
jgi:membrane protein DedA with SNARE-associated domain/rhodanese-related sulfurtransferase